MAAMILYGIAAAAATLFVPVICWLMDMSERRERRRSQMNGSSHDPNLQPIGGFPRLLNQGQDPAEIERSLDRALVYSDVHDPPPANKPEAGKLAKPTDKAERATRLYGIQLRRAAGLSFIVGSLLISILGPVGLLATIGLFLVFSSNIDEAVL